MLDTIDRLSVISIFYGFKLLSFYQVNAITNLFNDFDSHIEIMC